MQWMRLIYMNSRTDIMEQYRTKTYIAGDWDGDRGAIEQLYKWNDSKYWGLSFSDAHELKQARDTSLNCSIKRSLAERMNVSKTFVLIVGDKTDSVKSGSCQYCGSKNSWTGACARGYNVDNRSYIEYECEKAVRDGLRIIVLYNSVTVDKNKCPEAVRGIGQHLPMIYIDKGQYWWNDSAIKSAINGI